MSLTKHSNRAKNRPLPTAEWEWTQRKLIKSEQDQKSSSDGGGDDLQGTSSSPQLQRVMELEKMGMWLRYSSRCVPGRFCSSHLSQGHTVCIVSNSERAPPLQLHSLDSEFLLPRPLLFEIADFAAGRTFSHALQRLETKMSDAGYTLVTDALGFRYSLALLRKDTHSTLAQYNVRHPTLSPALLLPTTLHPCPLPLSLLPPGHTLPRIPLATLTPPPLSHHLHRAFAARRVPLSNPPLLALQLYQSDETPKPRFALASITVDGRGHAVTQDIVPMGSGEALALEMWRRMFLGRTGRTWEVARGMQGKEGLVREWVWDGREVVWRLMDGGGDGDGTASSTSSTTALAQDTSPTAQDDGAAKPSSNMADLPPQPPTPPSSTASAPAKDASKRTLSGKIRKIVNAPATSSTMSKANDRVKGGSKSKSKSKSHATATQAGFLAKYLEGLR